MILKTFKGGEIARLPTPSFGNGVMWGGLAGIWRKLFIDKYIASYYNCHQGPFDIENAYRSSSDKLLHQAIQVFLLLEKGHF